MLRFALLTFALLLSPFSQASERPFSNQAFDELKQQGAPFLVMIHADWCPTCLRQEAVLSELFQQQEYKPIVALRVDYDNQKSVVEAFGVRYQSTLILFNQGREVARSTAETDRRSITGLLNRAL